MLHALSIRVFSHVFRAALRLGFIPAASGGDGLMNFDEFCCHLHENYSEEVSTLCLN